MDGCKIFSIIVGLIYMAVLGVTVNFREAGKAVVLDLIIALVFGGAWLFGKRFFKAAKHGEIEPPAQRFRASRAL